MTNENENKTTGQELNLPEDYDFAACQQIRDEACSWCHEQHNEKAPLTQYACHLKSLVGKLFEALLATEAKNASLEERLKKYEDGGIT